MRTLSQETGRIVLRTAFRGEGGCGLVGLDTRDRAPTTSSPERACPARVKCPYHEGGHANRASIQFTFISAVPFVQ